jgi:glycosyltransferase involved in cell wall biosynthesis
VKSESIPRTIAFVGNYLPRKCGIATFTSDLLQAMSARHPQNRCCAVAVNDIDGYYRYPDVVHFEIEEQALDSYRRAAHFLNCSDVDAVSIQHEFGIFGGAAGSHVLALLRELKMPAVTTLHTVLVRPDPNQRRVMQQLIAHSTRLVIMTERGRTILQDVYQAPKAKIDLIPHGIPDVPFVAPDRYKDQLGVGGKMVLLTFGLLSPNKGIEHVLNALPGVVAEFPNVVYIVLGATHPQELRTRGEAYRLGLEAIARKNKLGTHVIFHNRFVELKELTEFIGAADLYVTPYLDAAQSNLRYFSLCVWRGQGRDLNAVLARRRTAEGPARCAGAIRRPEGDCREVSGLLRDETRRNVMSDNAYRLGRKMVWRNTAGLYMGSFKAAQRLGGQAVRESVATDNFGQRPHESRAVNLGHRSI